MAARSRQHERKVTRAAAISSAMVSGRPGGTLTRQDEPLGNATFSVGSSSRSSQSWSDASAWYSSVLWKNIFGVAGLLSLISACVNTPSTFKLARIGNGAQWLPYTTFAVDVVLTALFTVEAACKIHRKGLMRHKWSYVRDHWNRFDMALVLCHWLATIAQMYCVVHLFYGKDCPLVWLGMLQSPRPLILIRFLRTRFRFHLPRQRLHQIFKRSSQQVYNVTLFFLFFMALYGILGVQLFGSLSYHCVRKGTVPINVTVNDLAIPDTLCSPSGSGYECPPDLDCVRLEVGASKEGYYGVFSNIFYSVFTVYLAASQEGWVHVLYDCMDSLSSVKAVIYFTTLIFFLAWLVKNVFIAVITETFAEIRVQFAQMWDSNFNVTPGSEQTKDLVFEYNATTREYSLSAQTERTARGCAPSMVYRIYQSHYVEMFILLMIVCNATMHASFVHKHDGNTKQLREKYTYFEVAFTIIFDLECFIKIWCLSFRGYIRRGIHKFELGLALGTTFNVVLDAIPSLRQRHGLTACQAFRIVRLIKASPMLEDFVFKVFGPGRKLSGIVMFTMALLVITSGVSLQLFCFVDRLERFKTFPQAMMSMFQIFTQEGWTELVVEAMRATGDTLAPLVAVYFLVYHLFVTLIVLSLFVAVILDNLEMPEEHKLVKQLRAREQTSSNRAQLPRRLMLFTKFPACPQMVALQRAPAGFPVQRMRHSFARRFADDVIAALFPPDARFFVRSIAQPKRLLHYIVGLAAPCRVRSRSLYKHSVRRLIAEGNQTRKIAVVGTRRETMTVSSISDYSINRIGLDRSKSVHSVRGRGVPLRHAFHSRSDDISLEGSIHPLSNTVLTPDTAVRARRGSHVDTRAYQLRQEQAELARNRLEEEMRENHPFFDKSLFVLRRDHVLRRLCEKIVGARYGHVDSANYVGKLYTQQKYKEIREFLALLTYLDWFAVLTTCASCISMMFESPWPLKDGTLSIVLYNPWLKVMDYVFVTAMTIELTLKILANGLVLTPKSVVRDFGDVLTIFIYITNAVFVLWMPQHVAKNSLGQMLMIFRAMRPLRLYVLIPQIRRVVVELCKGFKEIVLVGELLLVLMFIFASFGVQICGGKLARCNDHQIQQREECHGTFYQKVYVTKLHVDGVDGPEHPTILVPRIWSNPEGFNFDNIGSALLAMFELLSLEGCSFIRLVVSERAGAVLSYKGWVTVRNILLDEYVLDQRGYWPALFLHIYVFIGCMIGLTLFVGVVIANYSQNRGTALLTVDQRRWKDLRNRLKVAQPLHIPSRPVESSRVRNRAYDLVQSKLFKRLFAAVTLFNAVLLCFVPWNLEGERGKDEHLKLLASLAAAFTLVFAVEVGLKLVAYSPAGFWQSRRNRLDCALTVAGLAWSLLHVIVILRTSRGHDDRQLRSVSYTLGFLTIILRFCTIAGRHATLKMLMLTVVMSMYRSLFIILGMFLLILFYAFAGVVLFGTVKYGDALDRHANFRTVPQAIFVLFRIVTGEDWNKIMHDCMLSEPRCLSIPGGSFWETDCGNYVGAISFFCSFYLIITYIVLNLLVAIIMENFSLFYSSEEDALLSHSDIRNFQMVWNIIDTYQKGEIPVKHVKFLLRLLTGRLAVDPERDRLLFKHMCFEMEWLQNTTNCSSVSFHEVLSVDIRKSLELEELVQREELELIIEEEVAKQIIRCWLERCLRKLRKESSVSLLHRFRQANNNTPVLDHELAFATDFTCESLRKRKKGLVAGISPSGRQLRGSVSLGARANDQSLLYAEWVARPRRNTLARVSESSGEDMPDEDQSLQVAARVPKLSLVSTHMSPNPISCAATPQSQRSLPTSSLRMTQWYDVKNWWQA